MDTNEYSGVRRSERLGTLYLPSPYSSLITHHSSLITHPSLITCLPDLTFCAHRHDPALDVIGQAAQAPLGDNWSACSSSTLAVCTPPQLASFNQSQLAASAQHSLTKADQGYEIHTHGTCTKPRLRYPKRRTSPSNHGNQSSDSSSTLLTLTSSLTTRHQRPASTRQRHFYNTHKE